ncbi:LysM domain receptor-like kinase 3 [Linum perenne]
MNPIFSIFILTSLFPISTSQSCRKTCDLALASFFISEDANLTGIRQLMQSSVLNPVLVGPLMSYNKQLSNGDILLSNTRVNVPFPCDCLPVAAALGHVFRYTAAAGDTYDSIARKYVNLTSIDMLRRFNSYGSGEVLQSGSEVNVTVNCSCGNGDVSKDYGLFLTYPLREDDNLTVGSGGGGIVPAEVIRRYNVGVNFSQGSGLVYIPVQDANGSYRPFRSSKPRTGLIAVISIASATALLMLSAAIVFIRFYRKKEEGRRVKPAARARKSSALRGVTVEKSVEFSYEELADATDNFSLSKKIGEGGFGCVYYAELRGQKTAIKKMKMEASKEFLAELKVLTNVHHLSLVRLIGYCVKGSLFLVYEYVENGNLSEHLRGRQPLSWSARLQIALDSARGLEYIHEHTIPVYIHRDIKSANILIDNNLRGKVADFGLAKLAKIEGTLVPSQVLVGTFGYMPPEYIRLKAVSPKVDVYAFGVILYELISGKDAIIQPNGESQIEATTLVVLFEEVLKNQPCDELELRNLVDSSLGNEYPFDSIRKMAELGRACTRAKPEMRPSMRSIVIALTAISSASQAWNPEAFYGHEDAGFSSMA